jgi:hypothetical protein
VLYLLGLTGIVSDSILIISDISLFAVPGSEMISNDAHNFFSRTWMSMDESSREKCCLFNTKCRLQLRVVQQQVKELLDLNHTGAPFSSESMDTQNSGNRDGFFTGQDMSLCVVSMLTMLRNFLHPLQEYLKGIGDRLAYSNQEGETKFRSLRNVEVKIYHECTNMVHQLGLSFKPFVKECAYASPFPPSFMTQKS